MEFPFMEIRFKRQSVPAKPVWVRGAQNSQPTSGKVEEMTLQYHQIY